MASSNLWSVLQLPFLYLILLFLPLYTVCSMYKRHQASIHVSLPWFSLHLQRDVFLSLKHMEYVDGQEHHSEPPLSLLKAALLRRAAEDVRRGLVIRKARQACGVLLNKGSIGIDVSKELDRAGEELDNEAIDVAAEANALASKVDWAETIFPSANEVVANRELRRLAGIEGKRVEECEWWEKRQATIIDELLQEFSPDTVACLKKDAGGSGEHAGSKKKKGKGKGKN